MELELKHIAPYLPYWLQWEVINKGSFTTSPDTINIATMTMSNIASLLSTKKYGRVSCKPMLRPLYDLTNEIEINGKKFVPMSELMKIAINEFDRGDGYFNSAMVVDVEYTTNHVRACLVDDLNCALTFDREQIKFIFISPQGLMFSCGYVLIEKLFEWHFDVFWLIEKGMAVAIED